MSLSTSLSNAVSGLTAAARGAEVVSSNVANVMTDGYGVRKLNLASRTTGHMGAGVRVVGVERVVNQRVLADRRIADGRTGFVSAQLEFLQRLEAAEAVWKLVSGVYSFSTIGGGYVGLYRRCRSRADYVFSRAVGGLDR